VEISALDRIPQRIAEERPGKIQRFKLREESAASIASAGKAA
jgi:hypothetical protein